jgi:hypothetical protein
MLDDLFLHGLRASDSARSGVADQMICVTDILNAEILGITSSGAIVRSVNDALARSTFTNRSRKGVNFATFLTNEIIQLPGNERLADLVAASGAYPGAFPPYPVKRLVE